MINVVLDSDSERPENVHEKWNKPKVLFDTTSMKDLPLEEKKKIFELEIDTPKK
jgi:hypothetical protein